MIYQVTFWANGQEDFKKTNTINSTPEKIKSNFDTEFHPDSDEFWEKEWWIIEADRKSVV